MRPISYKNSHANRTQINFGGAKRKVKIAQVSSTQLSGLELDLLIDTKKMVAKDGSTVSTYISQKGNNATTKGADPVYRSNMGIYFNGSQGLDLGNDVLSVNKSYLNMFSVHHPLSLDVGANRILEMGVPAYYSCDGFALGPVGDTGVAGYLGASIAFSYNFRKASIAKLEKQTLSAKIDRTEAFITDKIKLYINGNEDSNTIDLDNVLTNPYFSTGIANSGMSLGARDNLTIGYDGYISIVAISTENMDAQRHLFVSRAIKGRGRA